MIRLQKMTPEVYYNQSRDFQFIGRLYDLVLNSVKTNTDLIYSLPLIEDSDERLLDLMTLTFGFQSKHNYNLKQLKALCACFAKVIRNKGNLTAIEDACNALISAEGINETIEVTEDVENGILTLFIPNTLSDLNLLNDLLNYILPAGLRYRIIRAAADSKYIANTINVFSAVKWDKRKDLKTSYILKQTNTVPQPAGGIPNPNIAENRPGSEDGAFVNTTIIQPTQE